MINRMTIITLLLCSASVAQASFWCDQFGIGCPKPSWTPSYENVTISDGHGHTSQANSFYFADQRTSEKTRNLLMAAFVFVGACTIVQSPGSCSGPERQLAFKDRYDQMVFINAGLLAANWTNNPDGRYPGVALSMARMALEARNINTTAILPPAQAKKAAKRSRR